MLFERRLSTLCVFVLTEKVETVTFKTRPADELSAEQPTFTFLSCNRFSEDYDASHWLRLANETVTDVNVHCQLVCFWLVVARDRLTQPTQLLVVGDQIYADYIFSDYKKKLMLTSDATSLYNDTLHAFRELYRFVWSQPSIAAALRRSENWFLPDDHDVTNNFGPDMWANVTLRPFVRAAKQAFVDYQLGTQLDTSKVREACRECRVCGGANHCCVDVPLHTTRYEARGRSRIALLDLRFQRSFAKTHFLYVASNCLLRTTTIMITDT
jgi:hypothetical protein